MLQLLFLVHVEDLNDGAGACVIFGTERDDVLARVHQRRVGAVRLTAHRKVVIELDDHQLLLP